VATLVVVAMLLLLAYPIYEFTRSGAQDPVFGHLDTLPLPGWADIERSEAFDGSRWCIQQCRYRERTWASEREPNETYQAYETALRDAGWRPRTEGVCPPAQEGLASCWKRDEYVMDMWVRAPICDVRPSVESPPPDEPEEGEEQGPAPPTERPCAGALVTMEVYNAVDYQPAA
jgi:hypothetical protein